MNDAITLANYITASVASFLAAFALWRIRLKLAREDDAKQLIRGAKLVLLALGLHQLFWGTSRVFYALEWRDMHVWVIDHSWLVTGAYWLAFYGTLKIFAVWHTPGGHVRRADVAILASIWTGVLVVSMGVV